MPTSQAPSKPTQLLAWTFGTIPSGERVYLVCENETAGRYRSIIAFAPADVLFVVGELERCPDLPNQCGNLLCFCALMTYAGGEIV